MLSLALFYIAGMVLTATYVARQMDRDGGTRTAEENTRILVGGLAWPALVSLLLIEEVNDR